jgi:hypothetical protein
MLKTPQSQLRCQGRFKSAPEGGVKLHHSCLGKNTIGPALFHKDLFVVAPVGMCVNLRSKLSTYPAGVAFPGFLKKDIGKRSVLPYYRHPLRHKE